MTPAPRSGYLYGLVAYGWWGLVPLYFRAVRGVPALEILMHRVLWSAVFLAAVVSLAGRWGDVGRCLRKPRLLLPLTLSAFLVAVNWLVYIRSVELSQIVQASLGYFITPLCQVLLGLTVLGERMRPLQWVALAVVSGGVLALILAAGEVPWIGLSLAVSFSFYSLVRKQVPVDGLIGLTVETAVLAPPALACVLTWRSAGTLAFGTQGWAMDLLVTASGVVTAIPLLCFGQAARRLPLATLGFLQYLSPTIQFLIAVLLFREPFGPERLVSFAILWAGVAVFLIDSFRHRTRAPAAG